MRLLFQTGKQKELIKEEKDKLNISLAKLAKKLDVNIGRMNGYYYQNILLPAEIFNKFLLKENYLRFILEKKEDNWGKSKGGKNSQGSHIKHIEIPKESEELAEFYGIMLGDGNMTKIKKHKVGTYQIRIVGDSRHDKKYLIGFVKPLIERVFKIEATLRKSKQKNALYITSTGLRLVEFLESKGFKAGDKIKNRLNIPKWIKENREFLKACIRGLYDTDGSVYKLTNQNSHQISFRNYNPTLIKDVRDSLVLVGINCSRISKGNEITITKKSELLKFLKEIGFHNSKHIDKIRKYNLAP